MSGVRVFITSMGVVSPFGQGIDVTFDALRQSKNGIHLLRLFPTAHLHPLPVGEVPSLPVVSDLPRTHIIALLAAREALKNVPSIPDAVVLGITTGGMSVTEDLLKTNDKTPGKYIRHAPATVAECLAGEVGCTGPVLTVSTACSSGIAALKIALELLRSGQAKQVLAGGADSLCRLTYYGFNALQLVDRSGARPFDKNRRGMSVGEGAALFVLTAAETPPPFAIAELLGAGLSCDAYHPATPHPQGEGALGAMISAIADAGISTEQIDYIHLHGTGTIENDLAEAKAVQRLFGSRPLPPLSSIKGAIGHSLAAAGAIGTATSVFAVSRGLLPANAGFRDCDPDIGLEPVAEPAQGNIKMALVNAFGFGGNNASAVLGQPGQRREDSPDHAGPVSFSVLGSACLTGAGDAAATMDCLRQGKNLLGVVPPAELGRYFSERAVRRLKRLPRLSLALAAAACSAQDTPPPSSVFMGTGWGALTETYDFIKKLFDTGEQFTSPTDFIGSVHNAAAGQIAIHFQAKGPNITATGGNCSFEQALITAALLTQENGDPVLALGADEYHPVFSPLLDTSAANAETSSDGGGALLLKPATKDGQIRCSFLAYAGGRSGIVPGLVSRLGKDEMADRFGAILVGIPAAEREEGEKQLKEFLSLTHYPHPMIDYRPLIGEFASASAVAAVLAVSFVRAGEITQEGRPESLHGRGILVMGLGQYVTAVEVMP